MNWFTRKKNSKLYLMNWTKLSLKCLATKNSILFSTFPKKKHLADFVENSCKIFLGLIS